jgi:hypothetical protein
MSTPLSPSLKLTLIGVWGLLVKLEFAGAVMLMAGAVASTTVKVAALLVTPPTVTITEAAPRGTPRGTGTTMVVSLQEAGVAATPAKVTVLVPRVAPKPLPLMLTEVLTGPDTGDRVEMCGPAADPKRISTAARL